jgi:hypothetical protein
MKNKSNDSEVVTRGILRETLSLALDDVVMKISTKIGEKVDEAVGNLAIMTEKGFVAVAKDISSLTNRMDKFEKSVNGRFEKVEGQIGQLSGELKEVRKEIKINNLKTQGDTASLDFRVSKLEKKVQP